MTAPSSRQTLELTSLERAHFQRRTRMKSMSSLYMEDNRGRGNQESRMFACAARTIYRHINNTETDGFQCTSVPSASPRSTGFEVPTLGTPRSQCLRVRQATSSLYLLSRRHARSIYPYTCIDVSVSDGYKTSLYKRRIPLTSNYALQARAYCSSEPR